VGRGKTHLAAALARSLLLSGHRVRFARVQTLFDEIKAAMSEHKDLAKKRYFSTVTVLIVDELAELDTDWQRRVLADILEARYEGGSTTIITTNHTLQDLADAFGDAGDRIVSRLNEWCPLIQLRGVDARGMGVRA
jgi:DNA replication protein DnaC